jgi:hypothetical protein
MDAIMEESMLKYGGKSIYIVFDVNLEGIFKIYID